MTRHDRDQQDVMNAIAEMTAAFERGDIDRVMASYEDVATVCFEPGAPTTDHARIRAKFEQMSSLSPRFDYGEHEVLLAGDTAIHTAPWSMRATAPDGTPIEQRGLSVAVLRRQRDGSWLMVTDNPHGQRLLA